jgi:CBS domain-containing protein
MDCQSIMRRTATPLYDDAPLSTAIDFMVEKHMGLVPVVDRNEAFVGQLSGDRLMRAMLPKAFTYVRGVDNVSYVRESREELRERLDELRNNPVGSIIDRNVTVVHPDTSITEAVLLMSKNQNVIPVVEEGTEKLLGAISFFTVLEALMEIES